ncbi:hypothetical protein [Azohydromonas aeria]|uniref:hypothetical protein n=1 Tax=Azohydromonas aeria TaxID=2590212 RepID=UPI0012FB1989|nr:hypothetical protein [Azohydromonas aeria]
MSRTNDTETAVVVLVLVTVLIWIYQGYVWLSTGMWQSLDLLTALAWVGGPMVTNWVVWPQTWQGLHKLLGWIPISVLPLAFAVAVAAGE